MNHHVCRVVSFEIVGPYRLRVEFDDGTSRTIDFLPVLRGEIFSPLRDRIVFEQVRLDSAFHTLVWPNGADFDPATLYEWPEDTAQLEQVARQWESGTVGRR
ncbi:MAG TPA: DUF2442 domain-containing protein [bacterium]|nr:DUF2442 domain-containing protein [bacterium]HQP97589.1 DUF2442 domain-containing protein [bacterium]